MPTYEYECEGCKRAFEVEQKMSDPALLTCPLPDPRTDEERQRSFDTAGGAISWNHRPFYQHPDRCVCQGHDPYPHRHYDPERGSGGCARSCARCTECDVYRPAEQQACGAPVRRLISGSTSFVLKGGGWFKDGY